MLFMGRPLQSKYFGIHDDAAVIKYNTDGSGVPTASLTSGGNGYSGNFSINVTGALGTKANLKYSTNGSSVITPAITSGGSGYLSNFTVACTDAGGGTFTIYATVTANAVSAVAVAAKANLQYSTDNSGVVTASIVSGGVNYTGNFSVLCTDAGTGTFTVNATVVNGVVTSVGVTGTTGTITHNQTNINISGGVGTVPNPPGVPSGSITINQSNIVITGAVGTVPTPGGGTFAIAATVAAGAVTGVVAGSVTGTLLPSLTNVAVTVPTEPGQSFHIIPDSCWIPGQGSAEGCYIVSQKATNYFVVHGTSSGTTGICKLVSGVPAAAGQMQILVTPSDGVGGSLTAENARKFTTNTVCTFEGHRYVWSGFQTPIAGLPSGDAQLGDDTNT
jgi:hypothetical protein